VQQICDTLKSALTRVIGGGGSSMASHAVTFITGPSRSADIELTLAMGVHGPKAVHVLLLDAEAGSNPSERGQGL